MIPGSGGEISGGEARPATFRHVAWTARRPNAGCTAVRGRAAHVIASMVL
jgi:hypothetical protein